MLEQSFRVQFKGFDKSRKTKSDNWLSSGAAGCTNLLKGVLLPLNNWERVYVLILSHEFFPRLFQEASISYMQKNWLPKFPLYIFASFLF